MQLISKFNKEFRFLLCIIDIYSKYAWVIPLKDKKEITITSSFQKILQESNRKPNKILFDKGGEIYNRSMKSWLEKNGIEMYPTHNEGESVIAERLIRTSKNKLCKYMIDKLDDIINNYNNTYHSTIKMKPVETLILTLVKKSIIKILSLKLVILLEYQNIKIFMQNFTLQIGLKKFL